MPQTGETWDWPVERLVDAPLPRSVRTRRPPPATRALPPADALLTASGGNHLAEISGGSDVALGLFLADPFLPSAARLAALGYGWLAAWPSVARHDTGFRSFLDDVDLSVRREHAVLAEARSCGMRVVACASEPDGIDIAVDAVLVVGTVGKAARSVRDFRDAGIAVPLIATTDDPDADAVLRGPATR